LELLKQVKKNWSHKTCNHKYQNERHHDENRTERYLHGRRRHIRSTSMTVLLEWQTQHFIQTVSLPTNL